VVPPRLRAPPMVGPGPGGLGRDTSLNAWMMFAQRLQGESMARWEDDRSYYVLRYESGVSSVQAWDCGDCGAIVVDKALHDSFHKKLGPSQEEWTSAAWIR
jgi:hypothetical protein